MPDLDLLPPGHAMVAAPRPPGGLSDVLARATRRRRRQQAGALATGTAACIVVLALTMTSGGAVDSLGVTPAHPVEQPGAHVVVEHHASAQDAGEAAGTDGTAASSDDQSAGAAQQAAVVGNTPQRPAPAAGTPKQAGGEVGPQHTTRSYDPSRGCTGDAPVAPTGWCGYYDGATVGRAGQPVELAETLCRLPGQGDGTLRTDTGQQAEFSATNQDAYLKWTWSKGRRFSKQGMTFHVVAGTCIRWHVTWNVVDNAGRPLAAGAYSLDARSTAYPPGVPYTRSNAAAFVTFTVMS